MRASWSVTLFLFYQELKRGNSIGCGSFLSINIEHIVVDKTSLACFAADKLRKNCASIGGSHLHDVQWELSLRLEERKQNKPGFDHIFNKEHFPNQIKELSAELLRRSDALIVAWALMCGGYISVLVLAVSLLLIFLWMIHEMNSQWYCCLSTTHFMHLLKKTKNMLPW